MGTYVARDRNSCIFHKQACNRKNGSSAAHAPTGLLHPVRTGCQVESMDISKLQTSGHELQRKSSTAEDEIAVWNSRIMEIMAV